MKTQTERVVLDFKDYSPNKNRRNKDIGTTYLLTDRISSTVYLYLSYLLK